MDAFEKSQPGQIAYSLPTLEACFAEYQPPREYLREKPAALPELSELNLTRHFSNLERMNMSIDTHFYPLGSCTMKLNPRINEAVAAMPAFSEMHPLADTYTSQGCLQVMGELIAFLSKLCGMAGGTLAPNAGAQGELCGVQMIAAYHKKRGDSQRTEMLVPDSAHGTNPATAAIAGFKAVTVASSADGDVDLEDLKSKVSERTAGLMLTNPSTLGQFSSQIQEIAKVVHDVGGLLYYDGANLNPIMEVVRPGDMGFDVMHINLHKTFSTPHGGGGPGGAPVLCQKHLLPFLPIPVLIHENGQWELKEDCPDSIGRLATFHGNFGVALRAYVYARMHGFFGLRKVAEQATLNANYLKHQLQTLLKVPFQGPCMHEFVCQTTHLSEKGIKAYDVAKRLLDYGFHSPTVYFPLIVKECFLVEPTETESKETLDAFIAAMRQIIDECQNDPEFVKKAPYTTPVRRLDEVQAAKKPVLCAEVS